MTSILDFRLRIFDFEKRRDCFGKFGSPVAV